MGVICNKASIWDIVNHLRCESIVPQFDSPFFSVVCLILFYYYFIFLIFWPTTTFALNSISLPLLSHYWLTFIKLNQWRVLFFFFIISFRFVFVFCYFIPQWNISFLVSIQLMMVWMVNVWHEWFFSLFLLFSLWSYWRQNSSGVSHLVAYDSFNEFLVFHFQNNLSSELYIYINRSKII